MPNNNRTHRPWPRHWRPGLHPEHAQASRTCHRRSNWGLQQFHVSIRRSRRRKPPPRGVCRRVPGDCRPNADTEHDRCRGLRDEPSQAPKLKWVSTAWRTVGAPRLSTAGPRHTIAFHGSKGPLFGVRGFRGGPPRAQDGPHANQCDGALTPLDKGFMQLSEFLCSTDKIRRARRKFVENQQCPPRLIKSGRIACQMILVFLQVQSIASAKTLGRSRRLTGEIERNLHIRADGPFPPIQNTLRNDRFGREAGQPSSLEWDASV